GGEQQGQADEIFLVHESDAERGSRNAESSAGVPRSVFCVSVEEHVRARNPGTAWADALEDAQAMSAMLLPEFRITPAIVHDDDPAGFYPRFGFLKTDRPHLRPFLHAIDDDDVEAFIGNRVQVGRVLEAARILEVERVQFHRDILQPERREADM